jgi:hypothetical protein
LSRIEKFALRANGLIEIAIPSSVEILCDGCFLGCVSLTSVRFESWSRLSRIESQVFAEAGLIEIVIPASVEVLCAYCFTQCRSLSSITFEQGSRLRDVDRTAFSGIPVRPTLPIMRCNLW